MKAQTNTPQASVPWERSIPEYIKENLNKDGIDRRGFLKCMAWAGTGALCVPQGGVLKSFALSDLKRQKIEDLKNDLSFVQISDSHIGFNKAANADVTATFLSWCRPRGKAASCSKRLHYTATTRAIVDNKID